MTTLLISLLILFLAALVKTTLGFGESLLAMPLLTLTLGLVTATPVVGLLGLLLSGLMVGQQWRSIDLRATWQLLVAALVGIPFGLGLLQWVPAALATHALGVVVLSFGGWSLVRSRLASHPQHLNPRWSYVFGFVAGVLGSAYNTSGPPLIVYSVLRGWPPSEFRATMQSFFLPVSLLIVGAQAISGLWTAPVLTLMALSVPLLLLAVPIGAWLQRHIPTDQFTKLVYAMLMLLGVLLLR